VAGQSQIRWGLSTALLLGTASAAYPWPSWLKNAIFTAGYYGDAALTTLHDFDPATPFGSGPVAGLTPGLGALFGTVNNPSRAFELIPPAGITKTWKPVNLGLLAPGASTPLIPISDDAVAGTEPNDIFVLTAGIRGVRKSIAYSFSGRNDGTAPLSGLTTGPDGALYGTASGGRWGGGVVYRLAVNASGSYVQSVIYAFTGGTDGNVPSGSIAFDARGRLYGSTAFGGDLKCSYAHAGTQDGCGVLFRLSPPADRRGPWSESTLHRFKGASQFDGAGPGDIAFDDHGNIYGATSAGGSGGYGTIYEASPIRKGNSFAWSVLWTFGAGDDGAYPDTKLAVDSGGALYGTAQGGKHGNGTVFILTPPRTNYSWQFSVMHSFRGPDGSRPSGGLILDTAGTLYGVTTGGGAKNGGTVFKLVP
jgi:uncharacterized repeat protein (TIGR03803 family)